MIPYQYQLSIVVLALSACGRVPQPLADRPKPATNFGSPAQAAKVQLPVKDDRSTVLLNFAANTEWPDPDGNNWVLSIAETAVDASGFRTTTNTNVTRAATLKVNLKLSSIGAMYEGYRPADGASSTAFLSDQGATVSGEILLETSNQFRKATFSATSPPNSYPTAKEAYYRQALGKSGYLESLHRLCKDAWDVDTIQFVGRMLQGKTASYAFVQDWAEVALRDQLSTAQLIAALTNADRRVRMKVAKVLGKKKDVSSVQPLKALLKDEDSGVADAAEGALKRMGWVSLYAEVYGYFDSFLDTGALVGVGQHSFKSMSLDPGWKRFLDRNGNVIYPCTFTIRADPTQQMNVVYCFLVSKGSENELWLLQKAWMEGPGGRVLQTTLAVPTEDIQRAANAQISKNVKRYVESPVP